MVKLCIWVFVYKLFVHMFLFAIPEYVQVRVCVCVCLCVCVIVPMCLLYIPFFIFPFTFFVFMLFGGWLISNLWFMEGFPLLVNSFAFYKGGNSMSNYRTYKIYNNFGIFSFFSIKHIPFLLFFSNCCNAVRLNQTKSAAFIRNLFLLLLI